MKTTITVEQAKEVLKANGYINQLWHKDDIKEVTTSQGFELNEKELDDFIEYLCRKHDANIGFNWDFFKDAFDIWIESKSYKVLVKETDTENIREVLFCELETNENIENWWKDDQYAFYSLEKNKTLELVGKDPKRSLITLPYVILKVY